MQIANGKGKIIILNFDKQIVLSKVPDGAAIFLRAKVIMSSHKLHECYAHSILCHARTIARVGYALNPFLKPTNCTPQIRAFRQPKQTHKFGTYSARGGISRARARQRRLPWFSNSSALPLCQKLA